MARTSLPLINFHIVSCRWWINITMKAKTLLCIAFFGKDKLVTELSYDEVSELYIWFHIDISSE